MRQGKGSGSPPAIWIDLDNAPHVPFFRPLIHGLEDRGHRVWVTARGEDAIERLVRVFGVECDVIGAGRGRTVPGKAAVVLRRAGQLAMSARGRKLSLAVSHGSRPQALAAKLLGVPALCLLDYEHVATGLLRRCCSAFLVPDRIGDADLEAAGLGRTRVMRYPGLKENVYLRGLEASGDQDETSKIVVLYRPESPTAHYLHGADADLEDALLDRLAAVDGVEVMLVARTEQQAGQVIRAMESRRIRWLRPDAAEGSELIRRADLVVTGGGTMGREAVALGVPAASLFRGAPGAVDRQLAAEGRLRLIRNVADLNELRIGRRDRSVRAGADESTYEHVLGVIDAMAKNNRGA